jgi:hypothetical protein
MDALDTMAERTIPRVLHRMQTTTTAVIAAG